MSSERHDSAFMPGSQPGVRGVRDYGYVDLVVMGRRCYEQGQSEEYVTLGKRVIVAMSDAAGRRDASPGIEFSDDVIGAVTAARQQGQRCFVFGGGQLVHSFVAADAVDMLTVSIVPVLLGGGGLFSLASTRPSTSALPTTPSQMAKSGWCTSGADQ